MALSPTMLAGDHFGGSRRRAWPARERVLPMVGGRAVPDRDLHDAAGIARIFLFHFGAGAFTFAAHVNEGQVFGPPQSLVEGKLDVVP